MDDDDDDMEENRETMVIVCLVALVPWVAPASGLFAIVRYTLLRTLVECSEETTQGFNPPHRRWLRPQTFD